MRRIKGWTNKAGYKRVKLSNGKYIRKFYIHRLTAMVFKPNPDNLPEVHHVRNVRSDTHIDYLKWVTHQENIEYIYNRSRKEFEKFETGQTDPANMDTDHSFDSADSLTDIPDALAEMDVVDDDSDLPF